MSMTDFPTPASLGFNWDVAVKTFLDIVGHDIERLSKISPLTVNGYSLRYASMRHVPQFEADVCSILRARGWDASFHVCEGMDSDTNDYMMLAVRPLPPEDDVEDYR